MRLWRSIKNHLVPHRGNAHRPHILRKQWLVALLLAALASEAVIVGHFLLNQGPNVFLAAVVRSDVIADTDVAREGQGGDALRENDQLDAAAQAKANDMAAKGYFSHVDPAGEQPWAWIDRAGYDYRYAGENLAVKFTDSQDVVNAWMASPTHRANIVKPQYEEMGVGIADGLYEGEPATFVVQFFASPSLAQAAEPVQTDTAATQPATQVPVPAPAAAAAQGAGLPTPQPQPTVAGAEVAPASVASAVPAPAPQREAQSFIQSTIREVGDAFDNSRAPASWLIAGIAALLIVVLMLTFFIRIQVQPTDLLLPGLAVALVAVLLLGANAKFLPASQSQSASVSGAQGEIGDAAAVEQLPLVSP